MNFHLFQLVADTILDPLLAQLTEMAGHACDVMRPIASVGLSLALILWIWDIAAGFKSVRQVGRNAFVAVMFYSLLWVGAYTQYVGDLFLHAIPATIGDALGTPGATPYAQIDSLVGQVIGAGATVYEAIPSWSFKAVPLGGGVLIFIFAGVLSIAAVFLILVISAVVIVLCLAVGGIFLAAATHPLTRKYASGWFTVLVGGAVTQALSIGLLKLMVGSIARQLQAIAVTAAQTNSNSILMLEGLGEIIVLVLLFKKTIDAIPGLSDRIGGGVVSGLGTAHAMTFGAAGTVGSVAAGGIAGGAAGAVSGARATGTASGALLSAVEGVGRGASRGYRYAKSAGPSLSRRRR